MRYIHDYNPPPLRAFPRRIFEAEIGLGDIDS